MSQTDLVKRYYDAFNRRDLASYEQLFTPDCRTEAPGVELTGIEGVRAFDRGWLTAMPDGRIVSQHESAAGAVVLCENRFRGTHTGPLVTADGSLPATGRRFDEPYMAAFELEGERIKRQTLTYDRLRVLEVLGSNPNLEIAQGIYAAFGRGDVQYILDHVDDDVSWGIESAFAGEVAPYGIRHGKAGVQAFFAAWGESADFLSFSASDFVAAGEHVFNLLHYEIAVKATGKRVKNSSCMQHWTFRGGKIVRWRGSEDTAATREAFRR